MHDGLLDQTLVHHFSLAVFFDLDQDGISEPLEALAKDPVAIHAESGLGQRLVALILEMEAVQVLHDLADGVREESELTPLVYILNQECI